MSVLADVTVETTLGAKYLFPDVEKGIIEQVLRHVSSHPSITLVNQSNACLVLPTRIVQVIKIDDVEKWRAPG